MDGPALVIAGPGSGKTSVICERIKFLIKSGCDPAKILVITFSKQAAINMQSRFSDTTETPSPVCFSTFHAFFYSILRDYYHYSNENIANNQLKQKILKTILNKYNISLVQEELIEKLQKRISYYKNSGMKKDSVDDTNIDYSMFLMIFGEYNYMLDSMDKIDFDDMQLKCYKLLSNDASLLEKYQNKYKYYLIDEYQDINTVQQLIMELLTCKGHNLFCVGDDDQSIYGFRGASPDIMQKFSQKFIECRNYYLSCNYRCAANIVKAANLMISQNQMRLEKNLISASEEIGLVSFECFEDIDSEIDYITNIIREYVGSRDTIAVLYRTNRNYIKLVEKLTKMKIECNVKDKPFNVWESKIAKDFVHYINMSSQDKIDSADFLAVMNKPLRYLPRHIIVSKKVDLEKIKSNTTKDYIIKNIDRLNKDLKMLKRMDMFSAFNYFRYVIGYEKYLISINKFDSKLLDEIQDSLREFNSREELLDFIENYDAQVEKFQNNYSNINIMTYHSAKGLEFDEVIIPNLNEGIVPISRAVETDDIEEERRMLYVAMTRARKKLTMSYINDDKKGLKSRFLYIFDK